MPRKFPSMPETTHFTADVLHLGMYTRSSMEELTRMYPGVAHRARFEIYPDHNCREMIYALRSFLLKVEKDEMRTETFKFPTSPWQFFKERNFPAWALKLWPVLYTTKVVNTEIKQQRMCPHIVVPDQDKCVFWLYGTDFSNLVKADS